MYGYLASEYLAFCLYKSLIVEHQFTICRLFDFAYCVCIPCSGAVLPQQLEGEWSRVQQEHKVVPIHRVIGRGKWCGRPAQQNVRGGKQNILNEKCLCFSFNKFSIIGPNKRKFRKWL